MFQDDTPMKFFMNCALCSKGITDTTNGYITIDCIDTKDYITGNWQRQCGY